MQQRAVTSAILSIVSSFRNTYKIGIIEYRCDYREIISH